MNKQQLILGKIQKETEAKGLVFVHNPNYANTGTCEVVDDDLNCKIHFYYDFQNSGNYMTFQFYPGNKPVIPTGGFTHETCLKHYPYLEYHETAKIQEMIAWFKKQLA